VAPNPRRLTNDNIHPLGRIQVELFREARPIARGTFHPRTPGCRKGLCRHNPQLPHARTLGYLTRTFFVDVAGQDSIQSVKETVRPPRRPLPWARSLAPNVTITTNKKTDIAGRSGDGSKAQKLNLETRAFRSVARPFIQRRVKALRSRLADGARRLAPRPTEIGDEEPRRHPSATIPDGRNASPVRSHGLTWPCEPSVPQGRL